MSATWLILGASSSIGRAFARMVAAQGSDVILAGRDMDDLRRSVVDISVATDRHAEAIAFDAEAVETHAAFAAAVGNRPGTLNVVLLFAVMPAQFDMDASPAKAVSCAIGTYVGAISVLHHLAHYLEAKGAGTVIGFGSVAGDRGRLKNYVYGSAKAGFHTYLAGLRNRLGRKGVHVLTVKPGFVDTVMTWGLPGMFLVDAPEHVARVSLTAAAKGRNIIYVPWFWRLIMLIIRHIPEAIFKKLSI